MKVLHVLRSLQDERALATARAHAREHQPTLLLLHGAVEAQLRDFPGDVYACLEDEAGPREGVEHQTVGYDEVVSLIFAHDRVTVW